MLDALTCVLPPGYGLLACSLASVLFGVVKGSKTVPIRLRATIPSRIANLLDQEKFITGKSKEQVTAEALELYFEQRRRKEP